MPPIVDINNNLLLPPWPPGDATCFPAAHDAALPACGLLLEHVTRPLYVDTSGAYPLAMEHCLDANNPQPALITTGDTGTHYSSIATSYMIHADDAVYLWV